MAILRLVCMSIQMYKTQTRQAWHGHGHGMDGNGKLCIDGRVHTLDEIKGLTR